MWSTSNIFCPTQKKAHKPQRCTGLNFYPETQQLTIPYLKRWLSRSIKRRSDRIKKDDIPNSNLSVCVCLVYPDILSPIIGTGIYHVSITQKYVSRHFPNTIFSKDWWWRSWNVILNLKGEKFIYKQITFSLTKRKIFCYLLKLKKRRAIACNIYVLCNSVLPFVQGYGEILLSKAPI